MSKKNTPKPHDRLPPEPTGDDASKIYEAVGAALTDWERLQEELAVLFLALVRASLTLVQRSLTFCSLRLEQRSRAGAWKRLRSSPETTRNRRRSVQSAARKRALAVRDVR